MKQTKQKNAYILPLLLALCLILSGCGKEDTSTGNLPSDAGNSVQSSSADADDASTPSEESSSQKGTRDNSSIVLTPTASGVTVHSCNVAVIDTSNAAEGYIMADYTGSASKVKLQITGPDSITYTYNLHGGYEVFPLTAGDGNYLIGIYENISDTTYSTTLTTEITVSITNPFGPYLYPNQYVNFDAASLPVEKATELAYSASSDLEVVEQVYNYIINHFTYDYDKAETVVSGYLPVVNDVYTSNTGICFDYAAVMATMLRSQSIPTRLEVGYMGEEYHAWISTYIEDMGWINGIIEFDGTDWQLMDPTFASTSKAPKDFITENNKYMTKYVY